MTDSLHIREADMEHFHKRSNIETAFIMLKGKFGSALRSKNDTGQINEALCARYLRTTFAYWCRLSTS